MPVLFPRIYAEFLFSQSGMCANEQKFLASTDFTLCWWNYNPTEISGEAVGVTGVTSCPLSSPGKGIGHQRGEGTGRDPHCGSACHGHWERRRPLFCYIAMVFGKNVRLNSTDSTFIFIHLEISASKEELTVRFPFIDAL